MPGVQQGEAQPVKGCPTAPVPQDPPSSSTNSSEDPTENATPQPTQQIQEENKVESPEPTQKTEDNMSPEDAPSTSPLAGEEGPGPLIPQPQGGTSSPSSTSGVALASPPVAFNLTCMTCHTHFTSAEEYTRHHCVSSESRGQQQQQQHQQDQNDSSSDVEKFDGKIVYNPDGSAYIIDSEMSDDDCGLDLPRQEGAVVDSPGNPLSSTAAPTIPTIANAIYVTKNPAFYNALYGQTFTSLIQENKVPDVPIVHNYRVITVGDKDGQNECKDSDSKNDSSSEKTKLPLLDYSQVPIKPILMCFVCKLSFGYVKSFIAHAMGDHSIVLMDEEKDLLAGKNASAIIQCGGREKEPRVSFLEPVKPPSVGANSNNCSSSTSSSSGCNNGRPVEALAALMPSGVPSGPSSSPHLQQPSPVIKTEDQHHNATEEEHPSNDLPIKREVTDFYDMVRQQQAHHLEQQRQQQQFLQQHHQHQQQLHAERFPPPPHPAAVRTPDLSRKSPISALGANGRASVSPVTSMSPTTFSPLQSPVSQLTGTIIGACPEHMNGRPHGVTCDKCDMILQSSRTIGGQMAFMHSRNSCKTLKCPKCNWHYKYQETLEIHMKEKHPDTESTCIYCLTNQAHPRLARGETYTCGYKPYRCEVCNYSTTTKGNLSIHMQSDKHLNNMQELQNGGMPLDSTLSSPGGLTQPQQSPANSIYSAPKTPTPSTTPAPSQQLQQQQQKPKPVWRCDVCNYETNVARNLRIHMTSEKHTHNMMVLQQNVKHMQQLNVLQGGGGGPGGQMDPMALLQMAGNPAAAAMMAQAAQLQGMGEKPQLPEAALADMAYSQALLIQMISGGQVPPGGPMGPGRPGGPPGLGPGPVPGPGDHPGPQFDLGLNPESLEPPPEPVPPNPRHSFSCCVCSVFSTDSLEQLSLHLQMDRSKLNENEVLLVVAGNYICKLCSYKTNLKANFQLHCKTDKHLQKLQHVNHILEGGPTNEWKLKYLSNTNPMHVRCNLCEYYTNSVHKLQLHAAHQRHEVLALLFRHLCMSEQSISEERRQYTCTLCSFSTGAKVQLLHHIRSMRHLQMEQLHQIQRHAEGKGQTQQDIGDIFRVDEADEDSRRTPVHNEVKEELRSPDQVHACPFCNFTCESESGLQTHLGTEHGEEKKAGLRCPLCEEACPDMTTLEKHAIQVHSVNSDGLQRLLLLVRLSAAARKEAASSSTAGDEESGTAPVDQKPVLPIATGGESEEGGEQQQAAQQEKSSTGDADERGGHDAEATEGGEKSTSDEREKEAESRSRSDNATTPTPTSRATPTPGATPTSSSAEQPGINVPQIAEMAAALNALSNSAQLQQQMQFNPMSLMANLGLAAGLQGLPGLPMNPLAAMNLHPPLMPMMPPHMFDPAAMGGMNQGGPPTSMPSGMPEDVNPFIKQQILQQQQQQQQAAAAAAAAAAAQQKRARTRITDDQLKVLRAHFDINNSPTEDQINDMAKQSGLPPKVIKHWFRNTLFKERQRSKDSPYNFSIPPSTTLNLEEYEKTGEAKVTALNPEEAQEIVALNRANDERLGHTIEGPEQLPSPPPPQHQSTHDIPSVASPLDKVPSLNQDNSRVQVKSEDAIGGLMGADHQQQLQHQSQSQMSTSPHLVSSASTSPLGLPPTTSYSSLPSPQPQLTLASLITSQLESNPMLAHKLPHTSPTVPNSGLIPPSSGVSPTPSLTYSYPTSPLGPNMGCSSSAAGKRANRTRFTDYQIKVLQEFFENNAYPKDDDLEYLSKLLNLSPRVIVVWFQNARQKARKVYENQPPIDPMDEGAGRFTRTPGLNYQCKKCLLVFQRYYELIRHQKTHCFKEEDAKRSAQAQAAAAQAAAMYQPDENSNHSSITENSQQSSGMELKPSEEIFQCDKCSLRFNRFEQWREHQIVHIMNPALFLNKGADSPFPNMQQTIQQSMQQTMQQTLQQSMQQNMQQTMPVTPNHQQQSQVGVPQPLPSPLLSPASPFKRKLEEVFSEEEREGGTPLTEAQRDKRLRTTILPEQLDYLYQKYQLEANPSRKMLETIAQEVGLKKRVVQVWFQNTRARERKGQFRAHAQVINKKCPFCPAIFKVKSALESHLSTKHTDQYNKGNLNIDALPDLEDSGVGHFGLSSTPSSTQVSQVIPSSLFSSSDIPEDSIYKYHEEAIRRYLNDVNLATDGVRRDGESPLDLSKPLGFENSLLDTSIDPADDQSDEDGVYHLEVTIDPEDGEMITYYNESGPTSPASSTTSSAKQLGNTPGGVKRYRTQMSAIQVKLMKSVFYVYKTPTMAECELLGREIGLAKRVIQVWFQNARAKEKKAKLAFQKMLGTEPEGPKPPEECKVCNFKYSHKYAIQDHIFTRSHIESMKLYLEKAKEEHDAGLGSGVGALGSGGGDGDHLPSNQATGLAQQLQMAQLMALGSPPNAAVAAAAAAAAAASGEDTKVSSNGNEDLSRLQLLQQMYQMGLGGLQGAPHPLLQHAMMAGAGE